MAGFDSCQVCTVTAKPCIEARLYLNPSDDSEIMAASQALACAGHVEGRGVQCHKIIQDLFRHIQ